ncbi:tyrosine-type recombinase/integrase [Neobacillus sp. NPDC093127]|uniref:tyrosine-type recombinase/integrase n=1 Tax=Neobacillus sp. NPDC093127 TaxID=3364296 RepID=UPI003809E498
MKLSESWEHYLPDKQIAGYSPNTLKQYKLQVNLMIRYMGDIKIESIITPDLKRYIAQRKDTLKTNNSLAHTIRFIRGFFRWAHEEGYIETNPAGKIKEPKESKRVPKFIPEEILYRLDAACEGPREKALNSLLYATGCRVGEIHRMDKNHINWSDRSIIVLGKGDKEREVYFDVKTAYWLQEYLDTRTDDCDSLFVTLRDPRRATIDTLRRWIKDIAKRARIDINIYPHRYRHSFCTHLIDRGAPMEVISQLAGHSRIDTTKIYAALSGERRRELYRKYF